MATPSLSRAYTLRLDADSDTAMGLAMTTARVTAACRLVADWMMTARGLLPPALAEDESLPGDARHRRRVLVSGWFLPERREGPTHPHAITDGDLAARLETHLVAHGIPAADRQVWAADVEDLLQAAIRSDAIWIDRAAYGREVIQDTGLAAQEWLDELLWRFLTPQALFDTKTGDAAPECMRSAMGLCCDRWGTGNKTDMGRVAAGYRKLADWGRKQLAAMGENSVDAPSALAACVQQCEVASLREVHGLIARPRLASVAQLDRWEAAGQIEPQDLRKAIEQWTAQAARSDSKCGTKGPRPLTNRLRLAMEAVLGIPYQDEQRVRANRAWFAIALDHAGRRLCQHVASVRGSLLRREAAWEQTAGLEILPETARAALDTLMAERLAQMQSLHGDETGYRLRSRAITGWQQVVTRWAKLATAQERQEAALEVVLEGEEKAGDSWVFHRLSEEDLAGAWRDDRGRAHPEWLVAYVAAMEGLEERRRFLAPIFSAPEPFLRPVWVDYGASRPGIVFAAREAFHGRANAEQALAEAQECQAKAKPGTKTAQAAEARLTKAKAQVAALMDPHGLCLDTITASGPQTAQLRWQGNRFSKDAGVHLDERHPTLPAGRNDRLGRAMAGISEEARPEAPWHESWAGRLQTSRERLSRLRSRVVADGGDPVDPRTWRPAILQAMAKLPWRLSIGLKMAPGDQWAQFAREAGLDERWWPWHTENAKRGGRARVQYARLPGVRVMSVVPSLRHAATIAVWEAVTLEEAREACRAGEERDLKAEDRRFRGRTPNGRGATYIRLAPDVVDGRPHPAPWGRIERNAKIELDGEDPREERQATASERQLLQRVLDVLGEQADDDPRLSVGAAQYAALDGMRRAVQQRNRIAVIAWGLSQDENQALTAVGQWLELGRGRSRLAARVATIWEDVTEAALPPSAAAASGRTSRKAQQAARRAEGREYFQRGFAGQPLRMRQAAASLRDLLTQEEGEAAASQQAATGWHALLRELRDWLAPAGRRGVARGTMRRHQGGVSLERIDRVQALYRLLRSWRDRVQIDTGPVQQSRWESTGFGRRIRDAIDALVQMRSRQIAARITQQAVPLLEPAGAEQQFACVGRQRILVDDPRRWSPVHAVVVRSLDQRPDQNRRKRENRMLTRLASSRLEDHLQEALSIAGVQVQSVHPSWVGRRNCIWDADTLAVTRIDASTLRKRRIQQRLAFLRERLADGRLSEGRMRNEDLSLLLAANAVEQGRPALALDPFGPLTATVQDGSVRHVDGDDQTASTVAWWALRDPDWQDAWWSAPIIRSAAGACTWGPAIKGGALAQLPVPQVEGVAGPAALRRQPNGQWVAAVQARRELEETFLQWQRLSNRDP